MGGEQAARKKRRQQPPGSTGRGRGHVGPQGGKGTTPRNRGGRHRAGRTKTEAEIKAQILAYMRVGFTRTSAARRSGIDPRTAERWRAADPVFAEDCSLAEAEATDEMENALFRNGVVEMNVTAQQVWLYNRAPERWRDKRNLNLALTLDEEDAASLDHQVGEALLGIVVGLRKAREAAEHADDEPPPLPDVPDDDDLVDDEAAPTIGDVYS